MDFSKYFEEYSAKIIPWLMTSGLRILLIIITTFILSKILHQLVDKTVRLTVRRNHHESQTAEIKREDTLIQIFSTSLKITILLVALMMILTEFGIAIGPIIAAAGVVGLALGFGGQYLIRDIISGLFIILENQYRIGDVVSFGTASGTVEEISLRKTTLRDLDGVIHHVPHGELKIVSNQTKDFARVNLDLGVSYNADLEHVIKVINETGDALTADAEWKESILKSPQFLRVNDFADSSVVVKIVGETVALRQWAVAGELRKRLKIAFDKEGIEIPFPQVVVHKAD